MKMKKLIFLPIVVIGMYGILVQAGYISPEQEELLRHAKRRFVHGNLREELSNIDANPNFIDEDGKSPLYYAIKRSDVLMVNILLDKGADPEMQYSDRGELWNALQVARWYTAGDQQLEIVELLLKKGRANPNVVNKNGDGLLYFAARNDNVALIDLLIKYGANVDLQNNNGNTALHEAVRRGNKNAVIALTGNNASVNIRNNKRETPLDIAIKAENNDIITLLLGQPQ